MRPAEAHLGAAIRADAGRTKEAVGEAFACPTCGADFSAFVDRDAVAASTIACPSCTSHFPVLRGVPHFAIDLDDQAATASTFGFAWNAFWSGSFDSASIFGLETSETRQYILTSLGIAEGELERARMLDAGTGSGRMPMALRNSGCLVYAVDIHRSLDVVAQAIGSESVRVYQADLLRLPFRDAYFDYVWSSGVIHHTPDPSQAFAALARKVKAGGRLFVSVYGVTRHHYRLLRRLLPFARSLPPRVTHLLSATLAIPLYAAFNGILLGMRGWRSLDHPGPYNVLGFSIENIEYKSYHSIVLNVFDQLHPKYQHEHSVEEVRQWFVSNGFVDVVATNVIGMVEMRGTRR